MKTKRLILGIVFTVIMIGVGIAMFFALSKSSTSIGEVAFSEISMIHSENTLILNGMLVSSAKSYRDSTYNIQGDALNIVINSGIVSKKYPDGSFEIKIEDERISNINVVYLQDGKTFTLIYPK